MQDETKISEEKLKIILYTRERFFREGFAKITVDEIASELGMSKSTLYKYFPSKDILVHESILSVAHEVMSRVRLILDSDANAIEKFRGMIVILTRNIMRFSEKFMRDMQINTPHVWEKIDDMRRRIMFNNISLIIKQGQKEKLFMDYPPELILGIFTGALRNVVNPDFLLHNRFSIDDAARTTFHILISGILTDSGKKVYKQLMPSEEKTVYKEKK